MKTLRSGFPNTAWIQTILPITASQLAVLPPIGNYKRVPAIKMQRFSFIRAISYRIFASIAFLLLSIQSGLATIPAPASDQKKAIINSISQLIERKAFVYGQDFSEWPQHLKSHRSAIFAAQSQDDFESALQNAFDEFECTHLFLLTPQQQKALKKGNRQGAGITGVKDPQGIFITKVIEESPAWKAGVRKRDVIVQCNGRAVNSFSDIRAEPGDTREWQWIRDSQTMSAIIEYGDHPLASPIDIHWIRDDIALIRVSTFSPPIYKRSTVNRLMKEARSAKGLVLDLRSNTGGRLFSGLHLMSHFLDVRQASALRIKRRHFKRYQSYQRDQNETLEAIKAYAKTLKPMGQNPNYSGPVIVLIDRLSASGGEMIPVALQDYRIATIIGTQSAGALLNSRIHRLPQGYRLSVPFAEVWSPKGRRIEGVGIVPDIELTSQETADDALVYQISLETIDRSLNAE